MSDEIDKPGRAAGKSGAHLGAKPPAPPPPPSGGNLGGKSTPPAPPPPPSGGNRPIGPPPPGSQISMEAWRQLDREAQRALWIRHQRPPERPPLPSGGAPPPTDERPPAGSGIPPALWRAMSPEDRRAITAQGPHEIRPPQHEIPPASGGPLLGPRERPPRRTPPGEEAPPPDLRLSRSAWQWMSPAEADQAWRAHTSGGGGSGGGVRGHVSVPPPGSGISIGAWRSMSLEAQRALWTQYRERLASRGGTDLESPPPLYGISPEVWAQMPAEERRACWDEYAQYEKLLRPGERMGNPLLLKYLAEHPEIKTVRDLAKIYGWGTALSRELERAGLVPADVMNFRDVPLRSYAAYPPPGDGTTPDTIEEANRVFICQNRDALYNPARTGNEVTQNCGPTSLAMLLRIEGKMPPGLNDQEEIDYARAMMFPDRARSEGTPRAIYGVDGQVIGTIYLLRDDQKETWLADVIRGSTQAGLPESQRMVGWERFDMAMAENQAIVLHGAISPAWRAQFDASQGTYAAAPPGTEHFIAVLGTTPEGGLIVADPMYAGGTVVMNRDELAVFLTQRSPEDQGDDPLPDPRFLCPAELPPPPPPAPPQP